MPNDGGHHFITFNVHNAFVDRPVELPCGKCVGCVQDKAQGWAIRCVHESMFHVQNCFITLTYRDPPPEKLSKEHVQDFIRSMRDAGIKLRYFVCGEYGEKTRRPHYHMIVFGHDFRDGSIRAGMGPISPNEYYVNPMIDKFWGHGNCMIGPAEPGSIFYTTGYALKNFGDAECFHLASRRPFIGAEWLAKYYDDLVRCNCVTIDGNKHSIPAAYLRRMEYAGDFDVLRDRRRAHAENLTPEEIWSKREGARSRELNLKSAAAAARGDL